MTENNASHKTQLHEAITQLQAETKAGKLPRELRLVKIEQLTEEYYEKTGKQPDAVALERLSDLCLYEELTDTTPYKIANTEYPFMNERMMDERKARDVNAVAIEHEQERKTVGARRKRSPYEHAFSDRNAKIRNKERRRKYVEFTKVQPVKRWNMYTGEILS